ncbi:MAG: hypothetical protein EB120_03565 [Proteobacteria bacterium]|nr:hypothetical protein [Pseudomonadota bacterium]
MKLRLLALWIVWGSLALANPLELVGRYVGVIHHNSIERDQLVQLDILVSNQGDDDEPNKDLFSYSALLKLQFGDFKSSEYITYHFYDIEFHPEQKTLPLDHPDQKVSVVLKYEAPGKFTGKVRSNFSVGEGEIVISKNEEIKLKYPLIEPISGEYEGVCGDGKTYRLQSFTFRSNYDTSKEGDPFASYRNLGNWGGKEDSLCHESKEFCLLGIFDHGSYNFFDNEVFFSGPKKMMKCKTTVQGLKCMDCDLKRISDETRGPRQMRPAPLSQVFPVKSTAVPGKNSDLAGVYRGYLYHEFLGAYQRAELSLETFQEAGEEVSEGELRLSAVAKLLFGDVPGKEAVIYRFRTRNYPVHNSPFVFNFERPEEDLDAMLQIEEIGDGVVRGTWFSLIFGRVGRFETRIPSRVVLTGGDRWIGKLLIVSTCCLVLPLPFCSP